MRKNIKRSPKKIISKSRHQISRPTPKTKSSTLPYKPVLLTLAILGLLYFGYRTLFRPQSIGINQVTGGTGVVTLSLNPPNSTLAADESRDITLRINSGDYHVSTAKIDITYDPNKCDDPTVTKGTFLTEQPSFGATTISNGHIKFIYTAPFFSPAPSVSQGISGSGTLATITTGPKNDACELKFNPGMDGNELANQVWVIEEGYNSVQQIASASDAIIRLPGASIEPSPSLTPSPSPSVTPSSSPSASCPSNYTPAMCQAYLNAKTSRTNSTSSLITKIKECLRTQSFSYCSSKAYISCVGTKSVAECLP